MDVNNMEDNKENAVSISTIGAVVKVGKVTGELEKWSAGRYHRWIFKNDNFIHADGSSMDFDDFIDSAKDFFYGEWDAERSVVPIVIRFRGDSACNFLWWYNKDVRVCLEAYTSFYAAVSDIVKFDAHVKDIKLALGDCELESVLDPSICVIDTYSIYNDATACYEKNWITEQGNKRLLKSRRYDKIVVYVKRL